MYSACTGIVIKSDLHGISYLTSASLIRSLDDESKIMPYVSVSSSILSHLYHLHMLRYNY
jgi:hypothetical protein